MNDGPGFHEQIFKPHDKRANGAAPEPRFKLKCFHEITLSTKPDYLVKGIIPRDGLLVVWGAPKCGKSFWTFDVTMHIALGREYRGRRVKQGSVVYLALEGGGGFRARAEAWRRRYLADKEPVPFNLLDVSVDLIRDHQQLIKAIAAQAKPAIVVVDTLNRALVGDENNPGDMAKFVRSADAIREGFACCVGIVHHCGTAGSRPRGHTSLTGAADAQLSVERDEEGNIIAKVEYMKDGEAGAEVVSRLDRVNLGTDDDGDPITSCVIVEAVGSPNKGPKLPQAARIALEQLQGLIEKTLKNQDKSRTSENVRAVPISTWRERFYDAYPTDKPDTKQKAFVRASLTLEERKIIRVSQDSVSIAGHTGHARTSA